MGKRVCRRCTLVTSNAPMWKIAEVGHGIGENRHRRLYRLRGFADILSLLTQASKARLAPYPTPNVTMVPIATYHVQGTAVPSQM
jgi:hypothetical protein